MPQWPYLESFRKENLQFKRKQKECYDRRHRTHDLPDLPENSNVWVSTNKKKSEGTGVKILQRSRSYTVTTSTGQVQKHIQPFYKGEPRLQPLPQDDLPDTNPPADEQEKREQRSSQRSPIMTRTRTGTAMLPPERLY